MLRIVLAIVLALGYVANGARMVWDPSGWYDSIPGITGTGPMNPHFIRDIGFIYMLSGLAFAAAVWQRRRQFALWAWVGAVWPAMHGLFHVYEWSVHGLPPGAALVAEGAGVVLPALIGVVLALSAPSTRSI